MNLPGGMHVFERGWLSSNNILFTGKRTALVDSGYWTHSDLTVALVSRELGARPLDVLINTHLHSDHCGGNAALQARFPLLNTVIPTGQAASVRKWDPVALLYSPTGQHCPRFRLDATLKAGDLLELGDGKWEVHAAPGHDPHSVIVFEPASRTLLSADALWRNGFGVVFQELEGVRAFDEVAATLDLVESLDPSIVVPGHGAVFTDVAQALTTARQKLEAYVRDPRKHARHAAKVLVKFKLLEWQRIAEPELQRWLVDTSYFRLVHGRYFGDMPLDEWLGALVDGLVRSQAASRSGGFVLNA